MLLGKHVVVLEPGKPHAILVYQNGSDLRLEVSSARGTAYYNHPNDRAGFEFVFLDAQSEQVSVELCIHSVFRNAASTSGYNVQLIDDWVGYSAVDIDNLSLFAEAGRLWAIDDLANREMALNAYESIAKSGTAKLEIDAWARLALARGNIYLSRFSQAIESLQHKDADTVAEAGQLESLSHYYLGLAQLRSNDVEASMSSFWQSLAHLPNELVAAEVRNYLGEAELILGQISEGRAHIQEALEASGDDESLLAHVHNNMGFVRLREAYAANQSSAETERLLQASITEHQLARTYAISSGDSAELILIENNLGTLYERTGELRKANQHYREALRLTESTSDRLGMSIIYRHLGIVSQHFGDYTKAESYLKFAVEMASSESASQRTRCLLGKNHLLMNELDQAVDVLQECHEFAVNQQDVSLEIQTLIELAEVDYLAGQQQAYSSNADENTRNESFANALTTNRQARALLSTLTDLSVTAPSGATICEVGQNIGSGSAAASDSNRIEQISILAIKVLTQAAILEQVNGSPAEALTSLALARSQLDATRFLEEIDILNAAMHVYWDQGFPDRSAQCGTRALELIENLHQQLAAERNGAAWSAKTHDIYIAMAEMMLQQQPRTDERNVYADVFEIAERSRAINLRQQLSMPKTDVVTFETQKLLDNIGRIAANNTANPTDQINSFLPASFYHQRDLLELAKVANVSTVPVPTPFSVPAIQTGLQSTQTVLYYLIAEQQSYLFEVNPSILKLHTLGETSDLQSMMAKITASVRSAGSFPFDELRELSEFLLPSALDLADVDELIIVPHKGLDALPFAALEFAGGGGTKPLIEQYAIKVTPSLSTYFMRKQDVELSDRADLAVFADPVFGVTGVSIELASNELRSWSEELQPLPFTGVEAQRLTELMNEQRVLQFTGNRATLRNLTSDEVRSAKILHIATHGYFQSISSDNTGLALSAVDENGNEVPNFVTLSELLGHSFHNELVVISGCDTAMGLQLQGEGMMGLTRGFIAQGAKHVISTLWPVSDRASASFMASFYSHLNDTDDVSRSLQLAQRDLAASANYRNPYYWAGYVLTSVSPDSSIRLSQ